MRITKKLTLFSVAACFVILFGVLVSAYSNGREISSTPNVEWVSHTEYWSSSGVGSDEKASTIVRLTDYKGDPFAVDSCTANILFPDKTAYVSNAPLAQSGIPGNWYRADSIPAVEGTYEQEVTCNYGGGKTIKTGQSFHVNPALNFIKNVSSQVLLNGVSLTDVNLTILGKIEGTNKSILTQVLSTETTLDSLVDTINASLSQQLANAEASLDSRLTDANLSLDAHLGSTQVAIQTQLTNAETNLDNLIDSVNASLQSYLTAYLPVIKTTTDNIYADSQWLVANAMSQENAANITRRFNALDGNLSLIENFCKNTQTNSSGLCAEVYETGQVLDLTRNEQTSYFQTLNQTTTNTWNLLSGDITTKIDSLLSNIGVIRGQTTRINSTVEAIRADQTAEVRIQAIA